MRQKQHGECSVIPDKSHRMYPENNQAATLDSRTKGQVFRVFRGCVWYVLWSETLHSLFQCFAPTGKGVFSRYCLSVAKGRQVISVSSTAQELGDCKQK